jgi:hypothetical protein
VQYIVQSQNYRVSPGISSTKYFTTESLQLHCVEFVCTLYIQDIVSDKVDQRIFIRASLIRVSVKRNNSILK